MQAAFYFTPILYPITLVIERSHDAAKLMMLNPAAQIIQDSRYLLITHDTLTFEKIFGSGWFRLIPIAVTILFAVLAAWYFKRQSPSFAEEI
jgi:ABC-2 type transport system permease protein